MNQSRYLIEQFMWPCQHIFRISVETSVKSALEAVGFMGESHVLLVGFEAEGDHQFPICIDPEDGPYTPRELAHVVSQTEETYEQHPDRDMLYSDQRSRHLHPIRLRRRIRSSILEQCLSETPKEGNGSSSPACQPEWKTTRFT